MYLPTDFSTKPRTPRAGLFGPVIIIQIGTSTTAGLRISIPWDKIPSINPERSSPTRSPGAKFWRERRLSTRPKTSTSRAPTGRISTCCRARALALFAALGACGCGASLHAATFTWDGGHPAQERWSDAQNWNPNGAPPNDGTADLIFSGSLRLAPDSVTAWSINSITFNSLAGAFSLTGGTLTLQANSVTHALTNADTDTQTIANALVTARDQSWSASHGALSLTGAITNAYALTITGAFNTTASGIISGAGSLTKSGSGTLILSGANTYSGGTTASAGTLQGSTTSLQGAISVSSGAALVFDQTTTGTYAGVISGAGSVTKSGSGTVTFSGSNTYTGPTTLSAGTLRLSGGSALGDTSAVVLADVSGTTLDLAGATETIGSLSGGGASGGNVTLGSGGVLTVGAANTSTTYAGVISGAGSLTKSGSGTLTLSGTNTYSAGTTVSAGTLQGSSASLQGAIAVSSGAALVFDQTTTGTYAGVVSGSGSLNKSGSGTVTFSGANTYTGPTLVSAGTLRLSGGSALADTSAVVLADVSGATLDLAGTAETIGSLSGGGASGGNVTLGSGGALAVGASNTSTTFSGVISGAGSVTKSGSGTLTLSGANTYSAGTTVSAGTLQGSSASLQGAISVSSGAALVFDQATSGTYAGVVSGAGSLTKAGSGTLTLSGANTLSGTTTVSAGTLALGANNALSSAGALTLSAGTTLSLGGTYSTRVGAFSYANAILDFGAPGTANAFLFASAGTGSGALLVNNWTSGADTLAFASGSTPASTFIESIYFSGIGSGSLGATGVSVSGYTGIWDTIVATAGTFSTWDGGGANDNFTQAANWGGDATPASGTSTKIAFAGSTRTGPVLDADFTLNSLKFDAIASAFSITTGSAKTLTFDGPVPSLIQASSADQAVHVPLILDKTTFVEMSGAGDLALSGPISGVGGLNILGSGVGEVILSGANIHSGVTAITSGTTVLQNASALGSTATGTAIFSGATLRLENNISVGAEALTLDGTLTQSSGANAYGGAISGAGSVVVNGGTLLLDGPTANTYTGATLVNAGTLVLGKPDSVIAVAGIVAEGDGSGTVTIGNGSGTATLRLATAHQIADTTRVTLTAGGTPVFDLDDNAETIGSLASSNSSASVILGSATLTTGGNGASTTFAGVVSGSGGLVKQGSGTFTLSGANTHTGSTTVSAGTLHLQNSSALGTTAAGTSVSSIATLELANNITVGAEALALDGTLSQSSGTNTYGGAISGSGSVVANGGTLTLSGASANTYTGPTIVNAGTVILGKSTAVTAVAGAITLGDGSGTDTLRLAAAHQIADSTRVTLTSGGTPVFDLDSHAETIGSLASSNSSASVTLGSATLATGADNTSTTFAGVVSGTGGLTKQGTGTFTLSGVNTYTGATTLTAGTLALASSNRLSDTSALSLAGGTLSLGGTASERVGVLSYTGGVIDFGTTGTANHLLFADDGASTGTLVIRNWTSATDVLGSATNALDQTFLDNIFFDGLGVGIGAEIGSLTAVAGYGNFYAVRPIQTFVWVGGNDSGPSPRNAWNRGANWEGGIAPGVGADKAIVMAGSVDLASDLNGAYIVRSLLFDSSAGAFTLASSTGDTLTVRGGGISNTSAATQTLNLSVSVGANQTWSATAGDLAFTGTNVLLGANTLAIAGANDVAISSIVTGTGAAALVKNGAGTLALSGANTFTGTTVVNAGTLLASANNALGTAAAGTTIASGATLAFSGGINYSTTEAVSLAGSGADGGGALRNVSGANTFAGPLTLAADTTLTSVAGTLTLSGVIAAGGHDLAVNGAGNLVISSTMTGAADLAKSGAGSLTFSADQVFSGEITLGGGTFALSDADITAATLRVTAASILDFGGSSTLTVGQLLIDLPDGEFLTVTSWTEFTDALVATTFPGAVYDTTGESPMNRIIFADFSSADTRWHSSDNQVNPVPEPAACGALSLGALLGSALLRRRRKNGCQPTPAPR